MKMTILLVDDHPIVLEGMKALLASLPNTTFATATTAIRAREIIDGGVVDVMIADLELGRDSGLALAEYLHEQQPAARVVIYTMHEEAWTIHDILDCEPDAVVMKSDSPAELVKAVKALASGKGYYSQSFCRMLSMTTASPERLSDRELQVLAMTAEVDQGSSCSSWRVGKYNRVPPQAYHDEAQRCQCRGNGDEGAGIWMEQLPETIGLPLLKTIVLHCLSFVFLFIICYISPLSLPLYRNLFSRWMSFLHL